MSLYLFVLRRMFSERTISLFERKMFLSEDSYFTFHVINSKWFKKTFLLSKMRVSFSGCSCKNVTNQHRIRERKWYLVPVAFEFPRNMHSLKGNYTLFSLSGRQPQKSYLSEVPGIVFSIFIYYGLAAFVLVGGSR